MIVENGSGIETADSYVSLDEALEYFNDRNIPEWNALSVEEQEAALIEATTYIDMNYTINTGAVYTSDQALQFPRTSVYNCNGKLYGQNEIPKKLKQAVLVIAKQIIIDGIDLNAPEGQAVKSEKAGSVEIEYMDYSSGTLEQGLVRNLMEFITCGGVISRNGSITVHFDRG